MKTDFKMDGIYGWGNLCFVLTQFDRDFDCPDYWKQIPELKKALKPVLKKDAELKATLRQRNEDLTERQETREIQKFKIDEIENQVAEENMAVNSSKANTQSGRKRKRGAGDDTTGVFFASRSHCFLLSG